MKDTIFAIGSLVEHPTNGRGIIIDAEDHREDGMMFHVSWDEPLVWDESPNHEAEVYRSCWVDDIDVEIGSVADRK